MPLWDHCSMDDVIIYIYGQYEMTAGSTHYSRDETTTTAHSYTSSVWQSVPSATYASEGQNSDTPSQYSPRSHSPTTWRHNVAIGFICHSIHTSIITNFINTHLHTMCTTFTQCHTSLHNHHSLFRRSSHTHNIHTLDKKHNNTGCNKRQDRQDRTQ